jgi:hypothetical protein
MTLYEKLISDLNDKINELANIIWNEYEDAVIKDGISFLKSINEDLEKWSKQLADKSLSKKEFEILIRSKKELIELKTLKNLEISKACQDKFANDLLNTIISGTEKSVI